MQLKGLASIRVRSVKTSFVLIVVFISATVGIAAAGPITEFKVGASPERVLLSKDESVFYVANSGQNSVSAVEIRSGKTTNITVGQHPFDLAISPDSRTLYVVNSGDASISFVDTAALTTTGTLHLPGARASSYISITRRGGHLFGYVSNIYAELPIWQRLPGGSVSVVDLTSGKVVKTLSISPEAVSLGCAEGSATSLDGHWLFINTQCRQYAEFAEDPVYVVNTEKNTIEGKIDFTAKGFPSVGNSLAMRPDGKELWAGGADACSASWPTYLKARAHCGPPGGGPVTIIDPSSRTLVKQIFYGAPSFIAFSSDSKLAYLATDKQILTIDTGTLQIVRRIPVANGSGSLAFTKDGRYAYTSVPSRNAVVRVDLRQ